MGDVANSFEYGLNVAAKAYDGINKYIRITDIDDVSCKFLFNNLTSPNVNISEAINYQLKKGDILFARTGASVGKTYLYSEKDGMVFYAGFLIRAKISSSYDSNFIFQNTLTESYRRYIQITSQRSGQPGVNAQEYGEYKLMIPRLLEQKKIGNYFKYLDTLITLHQRKLEKLKIIKKSMLEKCFPKKGEKVPKIRFSGFTDDWEQRKLGDIVTRVIRKNENLESKLPLTISAQFGLIAQDEFFDKRIASKNISHYYLIRKGEFAYNKSTSMDAPWGAIKRLEHYDNGVLSTLYIMFRILDENKVNSDYIVSYYVTNLWHKGVREVAAEGARNHGLLNIAPVDFFETTLTIPSNENEQKNIGEYFRRLDRLITLHQRKLNILKSVPKFLLGIVWEQRKLGDIFEEYSEKGFSDLPALTIIQGEGTIKREDSDRSLKYDKASLLKYKLVKKGDFIVHLRSFEGGLEISKNIGVVSPAYHTFHGEGTDSTFYYWHFRSDDFIDIALKPHVYGIRDGRSINIEGMKTIKIPWTTLDEQSRIGNLIKCINRLITLHQRQQNLWKFVRKGVKLWIILTKNQILKRP